MTLSTACRALCVTALGLAAGLDASAQPTSIDWSGLAYLDYAYTLADDDPDLEGANSFDYRRIYLTADVPLDEAFDARIRLEARSRSTTSQGRPAPFVKDIWVRWRYTESGHAARLGVQPPPFFEEVETIWGYRSLSATLNDRAPLRDSRDMGLRFDGPIVSHLRYGVMVANGNGLRADDTGDRGKALYGHLLYSNGPARVGLSANVASETPPGGDQTTNVVTSAFVGAVTDRVHGGVEVFYTRTTIDDPGVGGEDGFGISAFGAVDLTPRTSIVARVDQVDPIAQRNGVAEQYAVVAFAYRPIPQVELMPNLVATFPDGADASVLGRFTASFQF